MLLPVVLHQRLPAARHSPARRLVSTQRLLPCSPLPQHAYYLQYKNVRPDYLKAIWRIVNWENVEQRLAAAKA